MYPNQTVIIIQTSFLSNRDIMGDMQAIMHLDSGL